MHDWRTSTFTVLASKFTFLRGKVDNRYGGSSSPKFSCSLVAMGVVSRHWRKCKKMPKFVIYFIKYLK